jgi:hypothetical protein
MATLTGYSMGAGGKAGYFNPAGWNTTLTAVDSTANEAVGALRWEGANLYIYAYRGTHTCTYSVMPMKLASSWVADGDGNFPPLVLTALGATAAGYFSCVAVSLQTAPPSVYMWFCVRGIATLPLNSNTGLYAFGTPIAPSSSSAGFAECAAASSVGRVVDALGATLSTGTQTAQGGVLCYFDFYKSFK